MRKGNMAALQNALKPKPAAASSAVVRRPKASVAPRYMAPSREGKTNLTAYLSQDYKSNMRLIQAKTARSLQTLIAEALNDLFTKYDVPVIDHE